VHQQLDAVPGAFAMGVRCVVWEGTGRRSLGDALKHGNYAAPIETRRARVLTAMIMPVSPPPWLPERASSHGQSDSSLYRQIARNLGVWSSGMACRATADLGGIKCVNEVVEQTPQSTLI